jgi:hypothetical protein
MKRRKMMGLLPFFAGCLPFFNHLLKGSTMSINHTCLNLDNTPIAIMDVIIPEGITPGYTLGHLVPERQIMQWMPYKRNYF